MLCRSLVLIVVENKNGVESNDALRDTNRFQQTWAELSKTIISHQYRANLTANLTFFGLNTNVK